MDEIFKHWKEPISTTGEVYRSLQRRLFLLLHSLEAALGAVLTLAVDAQTPTFPLAFHTRMSSFIGVLATKTKPKSYLAECHEYQKEPRFLHRAYGPERSTISLFALLRQYLRFFFETMGGRLNPSHKKPLSRTTTLGLYSQARLLQWDLNQYHVGFLPLHSRIGSLRRTRRILGKKQKTVEKDKESSPGMTEIILASATKPEM
jgi:hypothetical protein